MKYFIENQGGEWLRDFEHPGCGDSCWTRNPSLAWQFNEDTKGGVDLHGKPVWWSLTGGQILNYLYKEGVRDLKLVQHEFIVLTNKGGPVDTTQTHIVQCRCSGYAYVVDKGIYNPLINTIREFML